MSDINTNNTYVTIIQYIFPSKRNIIVILILSIIIAQLTSKFNLSYNYNVCCIIYMNIGIGI